MHQHGKPTRSFYFWCQIFIFLLSKCLQTRESWNIYGTISEILFKALELNVNDVSSIVRGIAATRATHPGFSNIRLVSCPFSRMAVLWHCSCLLFPPSFLWLCFHLFVLFCMLPSLLMKELCCILGENTFVEYKPVHINSSRVGRCCWKLWIGKATIFHKGTCFVSEAPVCTSPIVYS